MMKMPIAKLKPNSNIHCFTVPLVMGIVAHCLVSSTAAQNVVAPVVPEPAAYGSKIVFTGDRASQDAPDEIYVMNADGTGVQLVTVAALRAQLGDCLALYPRLSPNGRQIAFNCGSAVWLTDGVTVTSLANNGNFPAWSPDGKQIAFASVTQPFQIFIINSDGTDLRGPLINGNTPDWSPNGKWLLFARSQTVYVIDIDDLFNHPDNFIQLTNKDAMGNFERHGFDVSPKWSPDGRTILFERAPVDSPRHTHVVVMNPDEPEPTSIPERLRRLMKTCTRLDAPAFHSVYLSWSPDGIDPQHFVRPYFDVPIPPNVFRMVHPCCRCRRRADGSHREIRLTFEYAVRPARSGRTIRDICSQTKPQPKVDIQRVGAAPGWCGTDVTTRSFSDWLPWFRALDFNAFECRLVQERVTQRL